MDKLSTGKEIGPHRARVSAGAGEQLYAEVQVRFGLVPNFFRLAPDTPAITADLWAFARSAYLDNPLPSLFKERLFVYLSRFCDVRYCITRHVGFLLGLGRPAGDNQCPIQTVEDIIRLIRRPIPRAEHLEPYLSQCAACEQPLSALPDPDSAMEGAIFACSTHAFLQTPDAPACLVALKRVLGESQFDYLTLFLAFVHTAHYWTKVHTELSLEEDLRRLLATHKTLAECLLNDPEAETYEMSQKRMNEVTALPTSKDRHEESLRVLQVLQESEERFRALVNAAPTLVWAAAPDGTMTLVSDQWVQYCGLTAEQLAHDWPRLVLHPDDYERCVTQWTQALVQGSEYEIEVRNRRHDGVYRWFLTRAVPARDATGHIFGWYGTSTDIHDRKQTEEALRRSEQELADFFENATVGLHWVGPDGVILRVNQAELDLLGYTREEYLGHHIAEFHADQEVITDILQRLTQGETLQNYEARLRCKDGSIRHVLISSNVLRENGQFIHTRCFTRDITARKQTEEALRESEEKYRTLFDSIDEGFCLIEKVEGKAGAPVDFRYVEANPAFAAQSGVNDVIGKTIRQAVPDEPEEWFDTYDAVLRTGEPRRFERGLVTHGRVLDLYAFRIEDGTRRRVAVLFKDITARKQAEAEREALLAEQRRQREFIESLINHTPLAIAVVEGLDLRYRLVNPTYQAIVGPEVQLTGRTYRDVFPEAADRGAEEYMRQVLRTGQPWKVRDFATPIPGRTGMTWWEGELLPLPGAAGAPEALLSINWEITERKQTEEARERLLGEVQRVNGELQQFAHIVSHDLNEPLRTVANYLKLLARLYLGKLDADADDYITFAVDGAQRMQRMLTDLLAYTRSGQRPEFQAVDCEAVLAQALSALQTRIAECGAVITHDSLPTVQGDATRLGQVLQNLIGNALKFCEAKQPRIHISAVKEDHHWGFAVRDNGIGIDPKQAGKLFQVFQRLHSRSEYPGTGIGLAICKKIVEQHGGRIWVESQPGEGSIFYFTISDEGRSRVLRRETA